MTQLEVPCMYQIYSAIVRDHLRTAWKQEPLRPTMAFNNSVIWYKYIVVYTTKAHPIYQF